MIRFYLSQYPAENAVIQSLYEGCPEEKQLVEKFYYEPSDVAVVMGVYKKKVPASYARGSVIKAQKHNKLDCLILETGYINRGSGPENHYALGWNGLNGRADFRNENSPPDRMEKLGVKLKDWKDGKHIVLCGQVPWDASCDFVDHRKWLADAVENIKSVSSREIVFRPHPKAPLPNITGCTYSTKPLIEDLENAHCLVTFNSNSGVEALIEGVPVFGFDEGCMYWKICNKNWLDIENPQRIDRTQWIQDLCYAQFTPQEMRSVEAWAHISKQTSTVE